MGRKIRDLSDEGAVFPSLNDALLFTTMCIIGVPVDVHVKDGSIYAGIFHTACFEKDYGIILKKARMTKKGKNDANLAIGDVVDTLVVLSGDLVQVVAKGVILQADGTVGSVAGDDIEAVTGYVRPIECPESEEKTLKCSKADLEMFTVDTMQIRQNRNSDQNENKSAYVRKATEKSLGKLGDENGKVDGMHLAKIEEVSIVPDDGGQIGKGRSEGAKDRYNQVCRARKEDNIHEGQSSSSGMDSCHTQLSSKMLPNGECCGSLISSFVKPETQDGERPTSTDFPSSVVELDANSQLCSSSAVSSTCVVPPRSSVCNTSAKEFKLNPGAKTFSPSFAIPRSATPPAVPTVASVGYILNSSPVVPVAGAQPEIGIGAFAPLSSLPVKFVQYNNSIGGSGSQNPQPIVGHVGSRPQSVRYAGQYPIQAGPAYVHPNSPAVMVGRLGQLLYVHPVSHDVVQGGAAFSHVSARPLFTPHQAHLPKHQGNGAAQALQLCVAPPFAAGGQQPFAVPTHIPFSQSSFPIIHPIPVPGTNGLFSSKLP